MNALPQPPSSGRQIEFKENRLSSVGGTLFASQLGLTADSQERLRQLKVEPELRYRRLYFAAWWWGVTEASIGGTLEFSYRGSPVGEIPFAWFRNAALGEWSGVARSEAFSILGVPATSQHGFTPFHVYQETAAATQFVPGSAGPLLPPDSVVLQRPSMTDAAALGVFRFVTVIAPRNLNLTCDSIRARVQEWSIETPAAGTEVCSEFYLAALSSRMPF